MTTTALPERPPQRQLSMPIHMAFTKAEVRKNLRSAVGCALTMMGIVLLLWILRALPFTKRAFVNFEFGGLEELPAPAELITTIVIAGIAGAALCQTVTGISEGALTRSFLGAGISRRDIAGSQVVVGGVCALAISLASAVLGIVTLAILRISVADIGAIEGFDTSSMDVSIMSDGALPPLLAIPLVFIGAVVSLWALYVGGFAVALVFVRLPFYIPLGAWVIYQVIVSAFFDGHLDIPTIPWPVSDNPALGFFYGTTHFALVVAIVSAVVIWLTMRHLPIRRSAK